MCAPNFCQENIFPKHKNPTEQKTIIHLYLLLLKKEIFITCQLEKWISCIFLSFYAMMNGNLHGMHFKRDHSKIELNNCLQKHQMQPHFNDHKIQLIFIIFEYSSLSMLLLQKFSSVFLFYKIN